MMSSVGNSLLMLLSIRASCSGVSPLSCLILYRSNTPLLLRFLAAPVSRQSAGRSALCDYRILTLVEQQSEAHVGAQGRAAWFSEKTPAATVPWESVEGFPRGKRSRRPLGYDAVLSVEHGDSLPSGRRPPEGDLGPEGGDSVADGVARSSFRWNVACITVGQVTLHGHLPDCAVEEETKRSLATSL